MSFIDNYYLDLLEAERTIDRLRQERDNLQKEVQWWREQYTWLVEKGAIQMVTRADNGG